MKLYLYKFIPFTIILLTIKSMVLPLLYNYSYSLGSTPMWWFFSIIMLLSWYMGISHFTTKMQRNLMLPITLYIIWNIFSIVRGMFIADSYWTWKGLIENTFALLLPGVAYIITNTNITQLLLKSYLKYALPVVIIFVIFLRPVYYEYVLIILVIFFLFFPYLSLKFKIFTLCAILLLLLSDFTARGPVLKAAISIIIVLLFYFRKFIPQFGFSMIHKIVMILPIIFIITASLGIFNPFNMDSFIGNEIIVKRERFDGTFVKEDLREDTRSFLYEEVIYSAIRNSYIFIGRSPARGNDTEIFESLSRITGKKERLSNEAGILNVFTWTGIVGVILYFILFYHASFLAVNRSNNIFSKMLGLMLAFRWVYSWVSDENQFHLMYFSVFLLVGLCYSKEFREMTDKEVFFWIRGISSSSYKNTRTKIITNKY